MERETKEIKTDKHTYIVKTYLTYKEISPVLEKELSATQKSTELIKLALVSVDGITENPYAMLEDFPFQEWAKVSEDVGKLIKGDFQPTK